MARQATTKGSGTELVYHSLRRDILRLEFPPGTELDEVAIASRYRVSRTPVREALIRLTAEGLVASSKGKGSRVAHLDIQNLRDFFEGLDLFQRAATRIAAIRRTPADLKEIESHMLAFEAGARKRDSELINQANYNFYIAIAEAAHSTYLFSAYKRAHMDILRIGYVCFAEYTSSDEELDAHLAHAQAEHRAMYDAISAGEAVEAEDSAGRYVETLRKRVFNTLMSTRLVRNISIRDT